jgi:Na+/melibiose symporter-like transporter
MEKNIDFKTKQNFKELRTLSTGKAIIYCLPNMGLIAILAITVSFTLIFYINIMGQPPIIAGGIYSAGLFVYAIFCNIWGVIADKIGKKKVLLFSGPILAISFIFIWFPPIPTGPYGETFIPLVLWLIVFVFIFRIMMAAFQPILYSLLPELSTDEQNRVKISMINMMMMIDDDDPRNCYWFNRTNYFNGRCNTKSFKRYPEALLSNLPRWKSYLYSNIIFYIIS